MRSPRRSMGTPSASNSGASHPAPTPTMRRPPETTSTLASSFASTAGLRKGTRMMPLARRIRLVCAAIQVSATVVSSNGVSVARGNDGSMGSGSTRCSPVHTDSNPAASAACATCTAEAGSPHVPKLIANKPIFMKVSVGEEKEKRQQRRPSLAPGANFCTPFAQTWDSTYAAILGFRRVPRVSCFLKRGIPQLGTSLTSRRDGRY
jgi:hypothetical protein